MDSNRTSGVGHQVKGAVKEAAGKVTNDTALEMKGKAEKTAGKAQAGVGKAADKTRSSIKH
jgi:uncharacterized protein YjbJ (UPF0337 family)